MYLIIIIIVGNNVNLKMFAKSRSRHNITDTMCIMNIIGTYWYAPNKFLPNLVFEIDKDYSTYDLYHPNNDIF